MYPHLQRDRFNQARVVRIRNTAEMEDILVSEAYYEELKDRRTLKFSANHSI